ncbi:MAG: D-alanine--D-alanine ligase [Octadecabacter sp.]|nr:D-alanine--D-alanine ligase [Octadecabacter sp.]
MSSRTPKTIAVLLGGPSTEREVSLSSGNECAAALRTAGFDVVEIDADLDLVEQLKLFKPDVVFNALHGRYCEDGVVQGLLEWLRIPYTHSGVLASAMAMDKQRTKDIYRTYGLPFVESVLASKTQIEAAHVLSPPYVVKPFDEGSSIGISLVMKGDSPPTLDVDLPDLMMVEAYAPGRELTTAVLGTRALTVTDIAVDGLYDYAAKYELGGSKHTLPANVPDVIFQACMNYAVRAHDALGCRGLSRTDFRWDESRGLDGLILLETNTQPGMTPTSLAPEQAEFCGISFPNLMIWMVEDASCNR